MRDEVVSFFFYLAHCKVNTPYKQRVYALHRAKKEQVKARSNVDLINRPQRVKLNVFRMTMK